MARGGEKARRDAQGLKGERLDKQSTEGDYTNTTCHLERAQQVRDLKQNKRQEGNRFLAIARNDKGEEMLEMTKEDKKTRSKDKRKQAGRRH